MRRSRQRNTAMDKPALKKPRQIFGGAQNLPRFWNESISLALSKTAEIALFLLKTVEIVREIWYSTNIVTCYDHNDFLRRTEWLQVIKSFSSC